MNDIEITNIKIENRNSFTFVVPTYFVSIIIHMGVQDR